MSSKNILPVRKRQHEVRKFTYNGFSGQILQGSATYKAIFKQWTNDPGIAEFSCSDGKTRRIPTFALVGVKNSAFPKQDYVGKKHVLGCPCNDS